MSRNQCLLRYGSCSCDLYSACSVWFPCISAQISALRCTEVHNLSNIPAFTRISWRPFSTRCCNISKSQIDAEYTKAFRCSQSQKARGLRSGDCAGQFTAPPRPSHCSVKVWPRCCLTMRRKRGVTPSCVNMCCWWRGICSKCTGKSLIKKEHCTRKTIAFKNWRRTDLTTA
jgi:hypothetical protein